MDGLDDSATTEGIWWNELSQNSDETLMRVDSAGMTLATRKDSIYSASGPRMLPWSDPLHENS